MQISIDNIEKSFGDNRVLEGISFHAQGGQALGLLGRNGAGKTTTMRIIMEVFMPDSGTVTVDGRPIGDSPAKLGYMPEERGLYPKHVIKDQLHYLAQLNLMSKQLTTSSIDYWLDRLDMSQYLNKKLNTLSKGNQQKIQLASVLMTNPDIVILDEPFSGLDPVNAIVLKDVVKELIADDKIVIFSSHQMSYIEEFCSDIVILNEGKIAIDGNIEQIKNSYPKNKIQIYGNDVAKIANEVKGIVEHIEVQGQRSVLITLHNEKDKFTILDIIAKQSLDIDDFSILKPTLNEIFINTTGGEIS